MNPPPPHTPVFACWKRMFPLKPANLDVVVSLLLGALFAERYASESFQILKKTKQTTPLYYVADVCQWFS